MLSDLQTGGCGSSCDSASQRSQGRLDKTASEVSSDHLSCPYLAHLRKVVVFHSEMAGGGRDRERFQMRERQFRQTSRYGEGLKNKTKEQKKRWAIRETERTNAEKKQILRGVGKGEQLGQSADHEGRPRETG